MDSTLSDVVDCLIEEAVVRAHEAIDPDVNQNRASIVSDVTTDSFYDVDAKAG